MIKTKYIVSSERVYMENLKLIKYYYFHHTKRIIFLSIKRNLLVLLLET